MTWSPNQNPCGGKSTCKAKDGSTLAVPCVEFDFEVSVLSFLRWFSCLEITSIYSGMEGDDLVKKLKYMDDEGRSCFRFEQRKHKLGLLNRRVVFGTPPARSVLARSWIG